MDWMTWSKCCLTDMAISHGTSMWIARKDRKQINVNAHMDFLFDTLWKEIGFDKLYDEDISDLNKMVLEDPEDTDYEEIKR